MTEDKCIYTVRTYGVKGIHSNCDYDTYEYYFYGGELLDRALMAFEKIGVVTRIDSNDIITCADELPSEIYDIVNNNPQSQTTPQ